MEDGVREDNAIDLIDQLQPRAVIFENVKTMFSGFAMVDGKTCGELFVDHVMSLQDKSNGGPLFACYQVFHCDPRDGFLLMSRPRS